MSKDELLVLGLLIVDVLLLLEEEGLLGNLFPRNAGSGGTNATVRLEATIAIAERRAATTLHRLGFPNREASVTTTTAMTTDHH
jgi:hypothetical protein